MHRTYIKQLPILCVLALCLSNSRVSLSMAHKSTPYNGYPSYASALCTPAYINPYAIYNAQPYTPCPTQHYPLTSNNDTQSLYNELHQLLHHGNTHNSLANTTLSESVAQAISQPLHPQPLIHSHDDAQKLHDEFRELMQQRDQHTGLPNTTFSQLLAQPYITNHPAKRTHTNAFSIDQQNSAIQLHKRMRSSDDYKTCPADQMTQPQNNVLSLSECAPHLQNNILALQVAAATHVPSLLTPGHTHNMPLRPAQNQASQKESDTIVRTVINKLNQKKYMSVFDLTKKSDAAPREESFAEGAMQHKFTCKKSPRIYTHSTQTIKDLLRSGKCSSKTFMELITEHKVHPLQAKKHASLFEQGINAPEIKEVITQLESMDAQQANGLRYKPTDYIAALKNQTPFIIPERPSDKPRQDVFHIKPRVTHYISNTAISSFKMEVIEEFVNYNPSRTTMYRFISAIKQKYTKAQQEELGKYHLKNPLKQPSLQAIVETLAPDQALIDHLNSSQDISAIFKERSCQFVHRMIPHLNQLPLDTFHILEEKKTKKKKPLDSTVFRYAAQSIATHHPNRAQEIINHLQQHPLTDSATQQLVVEYLQKKPS